MVGKPAVWPLLSYIMKADIFMKTIKNTHRIKFPNSRNDGICGKLMMLADSSDDKLDGMDRCGEMSSTGESSHVSP